MLAAGTLPRSLPRQLMTLCGPLAGFLGRIGNAGRKMRKRRGGSKIREWNLTRGCGKPDAADAWMHGHKADECHKRY